MNAQGIGRVGGICEAWHWTRDVGEPARSRGTGILYCRREDGMLESLLPLTVVIEAKLVDRSVVDRPGMSDVPLLISVVGNRSESRHVSACSFEDRKRRDL